ncbi:tyrosine-type recombinase/integrase [Streptomyces sp. NPDC094438]|uniref:tyrosine-type recombinase/integrase n=1 Tax=Streptomyces sp. NPDC094438 TaxID=3366061 RepID=UPI0037F8922B
MTTPRPVGTPDHSSLLGLLMSAVRIEFRSDVFVFAAEDPVFGGGACKVPSCRRSARSFGLCQAHHLRWKNQGRPDVENFAATTEPRWKRQLPNRACRVTDCGYGSSRSGMCDMHGQRWIRAGRPELEQWLTDPPSIAQPAPGATCLIAHCILWPWGDRPFCHTHAKTWQVNGRPEPSAFAESFVKERICADEIIRLGALGPQMRFEIQYALQQRHDERSSKTPPSVVMQVVRFLTGVAETSLMEASEEDWRRRIGRPAPKDGNPRALLAYARRALDDLSAGTGWEAEYPRDRWRLRRLGLSDTGLTMDFTPIEQPQLRELAKRWARWRFSSGLSYEPVRRGVVAVTRFARFLASEHVGADDLTGVDRPVLERYLADLHAEYSGNPQRQGSHIGLLNQFFHAIRQHRWEPALPAAAMFFTEDVPKRTERLPRALAEHVMAQVEHPDNLAKWDNPAHRLVTVILMRCGLRVSDALKLAFDSTVKDADGAPYLRYLNHKMKREALVPIDEEVHQFVNEQKQRVLARWPSGCPHLFPRPTKNPDGRHPRGSSTYRLALYRWLELCEVLDEHGRPAHFTPHQWRHTLGTRMINRDVPQEVVRRILDHDSAEMTAHYARLHDTTVREHWEKARKVNISGQAVELDPDGPLAEAAWSKQRLSRATQALPNGYCGLPVQQSCPHANACLTCPMFITTPEFLPQHRQHRSEILQIITAAEARGQKRLVEMNTQVLDNLDTVITALNPDVPDNAKDIADAG